MTKICGQCKRNLPEESFWVRRRKTKVSLQQVCKECSKVRRSKYHSDNKVKEKKVKKEWEQKIKDWYIEYKKSCKCEQCGDSRWYVLEFHHLHSKKDNISSMLRSSIETLKEEISKCKCLCSNCHAEFHYLGTIV